jgi:hypothetical protein
VPTALDNGRRSPRKLLRAAVARLLGGRLRTQGTNPGLNERVAVVATLRPGSRERAAEIIARGAPYGLKLAGFQRHSVFLADEAVVFVFEGSEIEGLVRDLVNDQASSAEFAVWAPLLKGTPVPAARRGSSSAPSSLGCSPNTWPLTVSDSATSVTRRRSGRARATLSLRVDLVIFASRARGRWACCPPRRKCLGIRLDGDLARANA